MRCAALETSTRRPSVAARDGERLAVRELEGDRPHASDLLPALERALAELDLAPRDLELIVVGTGPGSYTGLRVGIASALGLARGSGAQTIGVPSVEALAWGALAPGREAGVLLDARAGELYFAHYRRAERDVEVVTAPCVLARASAAATIPEDLALFADETALDAAGLTRHAAPALPRARDVLELGVRRFECTGPMSPAEIEPLYLRAFAAKPRRR